MRDVHLYVFFYDFVEVRLRHQLDAAKRLFEVERRREAEAALRDVHGADFTGEFVNIAEEIFVYRGEARERPGLKLAWQSGGEERGGLRLADAFFLARELRRVVDAEFVFENHCAASNAS